MAGTVVEIKVQAGESIVLEQEVAVIESMKMQVPVLAPQAGRVRNVLVTVGTFVSEGTALFELGPV